MKLSLWSEGRENKSKVVCIGGKLEMEDGVKGICGGLEIVARGCRNRTCPTVHLRYLSDTYEFVSLSPNPVEKDFSSTSTK